MQWMSPIGAVSERRHAGSEALGMWAMSARNADVSSSWHLDRDPMHQGGRVRKAKDIMFARGNKGVKDVGYNYSQRIKQTSLSILVNTNRPMKGSLINERVNRVFPPVPDYHKRWTDPDTGVEYGQRFTDPRDRALMDAFRDTLREVFEAMVAHGSFLSTWRVDAYGQRREMPSGSWHTGNVFDTRLDFKVEIGPTNGFVHAHVFVGLKHNMMVGVNGTALKIAIQDSMNKKRADLKFGNKYLFGEPITSLFVEPKYYRSTKKIDDSYNLWKEYTDKEYQEARAWYTEQARRSQLADQAEALDRTANELDNRDPEGLNEMGDPGEPGSPGVQVNGPELEAIAQNPQGGPIGPIIRDPHLMDKYVGVNAPGITGNLRSFARPTPHTAPVTQLARGIRPVNTAQQRIQKEAILGVIKKRLRQTKK